MNCMPACIEMSMLYQGLDNVPSTEELRNENLIDGLPWTDGMAENVIEQYDLNFEVTYDVVLDEMIGYLDEGNVLYVMFNQFDSEIGHSAMIKGYWELGDNVYYIVSDPDYNIIGPFGYKEYAIDAQTMMQNMRLHIPKYFIIPPELE